MRFPKKSLPYAEERPSALLAGLTVTERIPSKKWLCHFFDTLSRCIPATACKKRIRLFPVAHHAPEEILIGLLHIAQIAPETVDVHRLMGMRVPETRGVRVDLVH